MVNLMVTSLRFVFPISSDLVQSYLTSRDELKRSQGSLQVGDICFEFIEGGRDAGL